MGLEIRHAYGEIEKVRELLVEYAVLLRLDPHERDLFFAESASLPGSYALPRGGLYIAWYNGQPAGCVAFKPSEGTAAKLKRLYVREKYRGKRIGQALVKRAMDDARALGYTALELGTMSWLTAAVEMYQKMGFTQMPPNEEDTENTMHFHIDL